MLRRRFSIEAVLAEEVLGPQLQEALPNFLSVREGRMDWTVCAPAP